MRLRWLLLALLALTLFAAQQLWLDLRPPRPVVLTIEAGTSTAAMGRQLKRAGVIRSATAFRLLARLTGRAGRLQSGEYRFEQPADLVTVLRRLERGDVLLHRVTVPEGLRTDEVLVLLAQATHTRLEQWQQALASLLPGQDLEGMLLPETYTYRRPVREKELLAEMIAAQKRLIEQLTPTWIDAKGLRIVASIIEKETALPAERPLVAAVIKNRLQRHMALHMDPTVIYGLIRVDGAFSGNLRKEDLKRATPWNTYTRKGLPPTPICNPGAASLIAAARPAAVDYLYFVADGRGGHAFASTLAEHQQNVHRWLAIEASGR